MRPAKKLKTMEHLYRLHEYNAVNTRFRSTLTQVFAIRDGTGTCIQLQRGI